MKRKKGVFYWILMSLITVLVMGCNNKASQEDRQSETLVTETTNTSDEDMLHISFGSADINHDGTDETFEVHELHKGMLYEMNVISTDGTLIWREEAGIAHVGWNSIFLCTIEDKDYLLRYNPTVFQGEAYYSYELFWIDNNEPNIIEKREISFSLNPNSVVADEQHLEMEEFSEHINSLLDNSVLLFSTENGELVYGGESTEYFKKVLK